MNRHIIPEKETIITLDANIVRNLCYKKYNWVNDFISMSNEDFNFCLSDYALFEFVNQFIRGSISIKEYINGINQLSKFISHKMPILFGMKRLIQMTGISKIVSVIEFDPEYWKTYSKAIWEFIKNADNLSYFEYKKLKFSFNDVLYESKLEINKIESIFQKKREDWVKLISSFNSLSIDQLKNKKTENIKYMKEIMSEWLFDDSSYSERVDILAKYLYYFIQNRADFSYPYNPNSQKNKNDGIDFMINFSNILPSLICSEDRFVRIFQSLNSYQSKWFYKPLELAEAWKNNSIIKPNFK